MRTLSTLPLENKKVLVRVDFNVPLQDGKISDDTRIQESLPTIRALLERNSSVILCSHLGRPKGAPQAKYSLALVAKRLEELMARPVLLATDCIGEVPQRMVKSLQPRDVILLENLRFHAGEEENDEHFARELASLAEYFVQDAFGAVHRAHASTSAITRFLPSAAGLLLTKELAALEKVLKSPARPLCAILGGAKVSDKIGVIENLCGLANHVMLGGAMAYTFLKAQGHKTGNSLVEEDRIGLAGSLLRSSSNLILPEDHRAVQKVEKSARVEVTSDQNIPEGWIGVDIGPKTSQNISALIFSAKTIVWNGPLGIFEIPEFSAGTLHCARAIARATEMGAFSIVGGGDSISALKQSGCANKISHLSTGGGASLEFLEGKKLPGVEALSKKEQVASH